MTLDLRASNREQMRRTILDRAGALLTEEGPQALSMRKLAQRFGMSTIVLYTYFKNKQEIVDALYQEGFVRLGDALAAVPPAADPIAHIMELGRAYRRCAVASPTYYQVMFSRCVPGFVPSPESMQTSRRAFGLLLQAVQRGIDDGAVPPGQADGLAQVLWGALHGIISLELFGYLGPAGLGEACLEQTMRIIACGLTAPSTKG